MLRPFCLALCVAMTIVAAAGIAPCAENFVISLKEDAAVSSSAIFLKDVAVLNGTDFSAIRELEQISLGPSPEFGSIKTLSRYQIGEFIQAAWKPIRAEQWSGAAAVQVRIKGRSIDTDEMTALLKAYIPQVSPWKASEIEIHSIANLNGVELPVGDNVQLRFSPSGAVVGRNRIAAPVEIVQSGKTLRCFWITAEIVVRAEVLTAAQRISQGKMVEPGDFVKRTLEIADLRSEYARSFEEVLGKVSIRAIPPGDPIMRDSFANPYLVKHGETVLLRLEKNGVVLTSRARAEQDGRLGQVIRVRNLDFATVLKVQVTGRSQVMLQ